MAQGQHGGLADMLICDGLITCKCSKGPRRFQKRQFPAQPIRTQGDAKLRDAAQGAIGSLQICQSGARSNNARPQSGVFRLPMRNKGLMVILIRTIIFSEPKKSAAKAFVTSVFPTPVGPQNKKLAIGRLGLRKPTRARRIAFEIATTALF